MTHVCTMNKGMASQRNTNEPESCKLCGKQHQHMSTPAQWRNKKAQELATALYVSNDHCICQPCRQDITKLLSSPSYTPRWGKSNDPKKCLVIGCVNKQPAINSRTLDVTVVTMVLANHKLKLLEPIQQTVHLCKEQYGVQVGFPDSDQVYYLWNIIKTH